MVSKERQWVFTYDGFYHVFQCVLSSYNNGWVIKKVSVMTHDYKGWVIGYKVEPYSYKDQAMSFK